MIGGVFKEKIKFRGVGIGDMVGKEVKFVVLCIVL